MVGADNLITFKGTGAVPYSVTDLDSDLDQFTLIYTKKCLVHVKSTE